MEGKDFINTVHSDVEVRKPPPVFKKRSENFKWMVIILVGIFIVFMGGIWVTMAQWSPPPNPQDYHSLSEYNKYKREWQNATEQGNFYGRILMEIGSLTMVLGGFIGYAATTIDELDKRAFMLAAAIGLIIMLVVSVGIVVASPYSH
jgi:hypothetical protein